MNFGELIEYSIRLISTKPLRWSPQDSPSFAIIEADDRNKSRCSIPYFDSSRVISAMESLIDLLDACPKLEMDDNE